MPPPSRSLASFLMLGIALLATACSRGTLPERSAAPERAQDIPSLSSADLNTSEKPSTEQQQLSTKMEAPPESEQSSLFFSPGSSTISSAERVKLKRLAQPLLQDRTLTVSLVGHTADNGSRSLNLAIADARLNAVSASLRKMGVAVTQIRRTVASELESPAKCGSQECRRQIRRVEFIYSRQ